eukprot:TRINITY_DN102513_c0_g1_i1.p1 TRINITY_DN102513_c0_g1~~TRINITY_DN102513_c0_g1_i1.p1  ORF type:complete len:679 (+),score=156.95 TRINITY_DN102513_c0_g1_i1:133-2037(+)
MANRKKEEQMSTQVLLATAGLSEYYTFFDQAGHSMFDSLTRITDLKVEQIILEVEARCGIVFNDDVRVRIWKALRYQWFRGPGRTLPFIERVDVPPLELPPAGWHEQDSKFKFADLESDRQRQIMRKIKKNMPGEGPALQTFQFEVYKRSIDLIYEFRDLERCVQEWERRNPRSMIQEDMREEVMRMRLKSLIDQSNANISMRRAKTKQQQVFSKVLVAVQIGMLMFSAFMLYTNYYVYNNDTPGQLFFSFFVSSKQFIASVAFFLASMFPSTVAKRLKGDPLIRELKKTVLSAERLIERISDFRIQTEEFRVPRSETKKHGVPLDIEDATYDKTSEDVPKQPDVPQATGPAETKTEEHKEEPKVRQRGKKKEKKEKKKDKALEMWIPDYGKIDSHEVHLMQKHLAQSYKRLEALPDDFRRSGGNRMSTFQDRLGGVNESALCIKAQTGKQKKRQEHIQKIKDKVAAAQPKNPPPPMLALQMSTQAQSAGSLVPRCSNRYCQRVFYTDVRYCTNCGQPRERVQAQTIGRSEAAADSALALPPAPDVAGVTRRPPPPPTRTDVGKLFFHPARSQEEDESKPLLQLPAASAGAASGSGGSPPSGTAATSSAAQGASAHDAAGLSPFVPDKPPEEPQ